MSYQPIETYALPSGNTAHIMRVPVSRSGERSIHWEVRELQDGELVQRRRYVTGQEAREWVLSVGGKLTQAQA